MPEQRKRTLARVVLRKHDGRSSVGEWRVLAEDERAPVIGKWETLPVVPAVLSPETVEKVAYALEDAVEGTDGTWPELAREGLRAAGFVSEPSTGGDDA